LCLCILWVYISKICIFFSHTLFTLLYHSLAFYHIKRVRILYFTFPILISPKKTWLNLPEWPRKYRFPVLIFFAHFFSKYLVRFCYFLMSLALVRVWLYLLSCITFFINIFLKSASGNIPVHESLVLSGIYFYLYSCMSSNK
jgi:hypothetical protein